MFDVSNEFNREIKAIQRRVFAKLQIDYTDPQLDQSVNFTASENNHTSYLQQLADGKSNPSHKYLSLGTWILGDKSQGLAPGASEDELFYSQMGYWGEQLSNPDGTFTNPLIITVQFLPRPIRGLKLVGDSAWGEYPVDFTYELFDKLGVSQYKLNMVANSVIDFNLPITPINEISKMVITITKWSKSGSVAKLLEIFTSIQEVYEGEDIISINILEEREVSQNSLPIGSISSNQVQIKLSNANKRFNVENKDSTLYGLLKGNRRIKVWMGCEIYDAMVWRDFAGLTWQELSEVE